MIRQLHISNFRAFADLDVTQIGRVNLIVGKNNVGKTALMEAIQFYVRGADAPSAAQYLLDKDEILVFNAFNGDSEASVANFTALFHEHRSGGSNSDFIHMFEDSKPENRLTINT